MSDLPNFSDYCEAACKVLWGEPDQTNRKEMRWGVVRGGYRSQSGRSYNRVKKTWYAADAEVGGSTLELIAFDKGWLDGEGKPKVRGARFFEAWRIGYDKKILPMPPPEKPAPVKWPIRKRYPYHDADGVHVYDVVRFDTDIRDDRFRYQRADGEWKLGKTPRVLYQLPATLAAVKAGQRVLVTEGEHDADTATALGYVATTNPEGLDKWLPRFDAVFAGAADVVIVSDNDEHGGGQAFAAAKAKRLCKVAARVRVIIFPQKDLSEWVKAGGTREQLDALIEAAPVTIDTPKPEPEPKPKPKPDDDDAEIERLAKLSAFEYERSRKAAAEALGVRAAMLDRLVAGKRIELGLAEGGGPQGRPVEYEEPEPWPEPVDGAALLDEIANAARRFTVYPPHAVEITALWVVHTYCMDATDITPRLQITAPEKGCGKSVTLDFLELIVYRPDPAANITTAAFFRTVEQFRPTLLIDEVDSFAREDSDIRNVLNSGHHVRGRVKRTVGDNHEVRAFSTFAALAYNHIGELPRVYSTLVDRSITIALAKRLPSEKVEPLSRSRRCDEFKDLRRRLKRFANDNVSVLANAEPVRPADVINRLADNWTPLLAIADAAGVEWPARARAAIMRHDEQEDSRRHAARRRPRHLQRTARRPGR
jgi:hypothetical protein